MNVDWERDLPDMDALTEGGGPEAPPPAVPAYLRELADTPDIQHATKVIVIAAYTDAEECEHICRYQHGCAFSEQVGLVTYHYERLRRQVVGAEEDS
jgi:hypothetical protein